MTEKIYVINGFYMDMRAAYVRSGAEIAYFVVEWDQQQLSWQKFRTDVIGATDPKSAKTGSLRNYIYENWQKLELDSLPNVGDNGVHGSASPLEALAERVNWTGEKVSDDPFAKTILQNRINEETLKNMFLDPQIKLSDGSMASLFDTVEDQDTDDCVNDILLLQNGDQSSEKYDLKNTAFIFVKPHAVTDPVIEFVKQKLAESQITIVKEGNLYAKVIEQKKLIDIHYGAIASKAMTLLPKELNPPQKKQNDFESQFGVSWPKLIKADIVFNAKDAIGIMGIDQDKMTELWAKCKSDKRMLKFGGGFYVGEFDFHLEGRKISEDLKEIVLEEKSVVKSEKKDEEPPIWVKQLQKLPPMNLETATAEIKRIQTDPIALGIVWFIVNSFYVWIHFMNLRTLSLIIYFQLMLIGSYYLYSTLKGLIYAGLKKESVPFYEQYSISPETLKTLYVFNYETINWLANQFRAIVKWKSTKKTIGIISALGFFSFIFYFIPDFWVFWISSNIIIITPYILKNHMNEIHQIANKGATIYKNSLEVHVNAALAKVQKKKKEE